ncbi:MAG: hypothetical protein IRZ10_10760 [Thermoflavifilum sp.]|nr:hypothetical protein [Thermoflavifilum sp.]MCL6514888.1 hypothetical protein [Alicyclobacillus sp.]
MPMAASRVYLYAAVPGDYIKCYAAADVCGIPYSNVIGDFSKAWNLISDTGNLVIAVGGAALYALYYNPCNWPNPQGMPGGHTPFEAFPSGRGIDESKAGYFVNAAGYTAMDSLKLAVMLAYYAVHGTFPNGWDGLPRQETPQHQCVTGASPSVSLSAATVTANGVTSPPTSGGVGLYADFHSTALVQRAIQLGWKGIAATGALGIKGRPYTQELASQPDKNISSVLSGRSGDIWWLSFWTVSWPTGGDSFYEGGYQAGQYAAKTLLGYKGKYLPNYVIIDPEGYNQPANTTAEWSDWLNGWAAGIKSVHAGLQPAFYCNQWQYQTYKLNTIQLPAFIAVSPIGGNTPHVRGGNVIGYIAYYATCPAADDVATVKSWGAQWNTVQFRDSGVDCGP